MSSTTNSLNSSMAMTQSYNNTGMNPTTSPKPTLKAKFQIGSVHGRIDFQSDERVFHPADMPEKAKQARESVEELLKTHILTVNKPHWDATSTAGPNRSGMRRAPWDNDGWDDRHYNKIQTQYLVDKAKHRIDCIRRGEDPDPDPNVIQPRWNVSTYVEPPRALLLSTGPNKGPNDTAAATSKNPYYNSQYVATLKSRSQQSTTLDALGHMDTDRARRTQHQQQQKHQQTKNITFLPQDYQSLLKKQTTLNETRRKEKEKERIAAARAAHLAEQWSHASDPDFTFTATLDEDDDILGRAAEERPDSLQAFIQQQQQAAQEQQQSSPSRTHDLRRTRPATMSHIKHTKKTATITALNAPSTAPSQAAPQPAWSRLAHKKQTLSHTLVPKPYIHHGTVSPDRVRAEPLNNAGLQSTTGVVGARVQQYVHEGVYAFSSLENSHVWSCCMQSSHDARGCSMRLVSDATHWNVESA